MGKTMGSPFSMAIFGDWNPIKSQLLELREDSNLSQNAFAWRVGFTPINETTQMDKSTWTNGETPIWNNLLLFFEEKSSALLNFEFPSDQASRTIHQILEHVPWSLLSKITMEIIGKCSK